MSRWDQRPAVDRWWQWVIAVFVLLVFVSLVAIKIAWTFRVLIP